MRDIRESLKRAMVEQGWIFGDKATRIGSPFEWTENEHKEQIVNLEGLLGVAFYFSMLYVKKETSPQIMIEGYEEAKRLVFARMHDVFRHFFPFRTLDATWENYIASQAMVRLQDYCFIKKYCHDLKPGINHLDVGSGLGSSAIYSLGLLDATFYPTDAHPMSYSVQRDVLRFLSPAPGAYLDTIEAENFGLGDREIASLLNDDRSFRIKHAPSWKLPLVADRSIDLVTATYVLNELNYAGIFWVLSQASRTLKNGGYFYIRDSTILKPGMHAIDYDKVLPELGFERTAQLEYTNRLDHYGIPRLFVKRTERSWSFEELVEMCLGRFASVAGGGSRAYNMNTSTATP